MKGNITELVPPDGSPRHLLKTVAEDVQDYESLITIGITHDGEILVGNSKANLLEMVGICQIAANRFMMQMYDDDL